MRMTSVASNHPARPKLPDRAPPLRPDAGGAAKVFDPARPLAGARVEATQQPSAAAVAERAGQERQLSPELKPRLCDRAALREAGPPRRDPAPRPQLPAQSTAQPQQELRLQAEAAPLQEPLPQQESSARQAVAVKEMPVRADEAAKLPPARRLNDRDLLTAVLTVRHQPALQTPDGLARLSRQLATHNSDFSALPGRDLVNLFVSLHMLKGRLNADALVAEVDAALDRCLKEIDVASLMFLVEESRHLPRDAQLALATQLGRAMPAMLERVMTELAGPMLQGLQDRSPAAISSAVDKARDVHASLVRLVDPQRLFDEAGMQREFEEALTQGLQAGAVKGRVRDLSPLFVGKSAVMVGKKDTDGRPVFDEAGQRVFDMAPILVNSKSGVSDAAHRPVDGKNPKKDHEASNVQLMHRCVTYSMKAKWTEPTEPGAHTTTSLFGDGSARPTGSINDIKRLYPPGRIDAEMKAYLEFLEKYHDIKANEAMTGHDARAEAALLRQTAATYHLREPFGSDEGVYRFELKYFSKKPAREQLLEALEPARVQVQQRVVTLANARAAVNRNTQERDAAAKERQRKRQAEGVRATPVLSTAAARSIEKYDAQKPQQPPSTTVPPVNARGSEQS